VLVLKDEHGRIVAAQEVEKRDEEHTKPFLVRLKRLGLEITVFYIDHWQAYCNAIGMVYPQAEIQYDYFHILQNISTCASGIERPRPCAVESHACG
jgi:transposase-like protein